jgi:hypothetical protein
VPACGETRQVSLCLPAHGSKNMCDVCWMVVELVMCCKTIAVDPSWLPRLDGCTDCALLCGVLATQQLPNGVSM